MTFDGLKKDLILHHNLPKISSYVERDMYDMAWEEINKLFKTKYEDERKTMAQRVDDFIDHMPPGQFRAGYLFQALGINDEKDRKNIYTILHRLVEAGKITKDPNVSGTYRKADSECLPMLWADAPTDEYKINLPLGLSNIVKIYPRNIIVFAGVTDVGKTGLCLNIVKENMENHPVKYFNSEMGASELKLRLGLFDDIEPEEWDFEAFERSDNFEDVIDPDALNIIDYMEAYGEFWTIGHKIGQIYDRLRDGVAIIALQKSIGTEYGRGATFGAERPRLYVSLDKQYFDEPLKRLLCKMVIKKGKNRRSLTSDPTGLVRYYTIDQGSIITPFRDWHRYGAYDFEQKKRRY